MSDQRHRWLLRPCRDRPGRSRAAEQCDELASIERSCRHDGPIGGMTFMERPANSLLAPALQKLCGRIELRNGDDRPRGFDAIFCTTIV
jgi:hypothetical protein